MTETVTAEMTGNVWQVHIAEGDHVEEGQVLMVLESMKMEIPIEAPSAGTVVSVKVKPGDVVQEHDALATISAT